MEPIVVGIDVSRDRVQVAVTDTAGQTRYGTAASPIRRPGPRVWSRR